MVGVTFLPDNKKVSVRPGTTLLEAARKAKVPIRTRCGGKAACLMCKVKVADPDGVAPMNPNEKMKLGEPDLHHIRLSCQAKVTGPVTVTVPEDPLKAAVRAQLAKQREDDNL